MGYLWAGSSRTGCWMRPLALCVRQSDFIVFGAKRAFATTVQFLSVLLLGGCITSQQLEQSSLAGGKTLTDLQYKMVLDNLAMFSQPYDSLPSHSQITGGIFQINDTFNVGNPSLSDTWSPWAWGLGFSASRKWQESWTIVPVTDMSVLTNLQSLYLTNKNARWLHSGTHLPPSDCVSGSYGPLWVWVYNTNRADLTDFTINTMVITGSTTNGPKSGAAGINTMLLNER
jgi:hypothetical protein